MNNQFRNNKRQTRRPELKTVNFAVNLVFGERVPEGVVEEATTFIRDERIFEKVDMPVFAYRSFINNNEEEKGTAVIATITGFENDQAVISVQEKFVQLLEENKIELLVQVNYNRESVKIKRIIAVKSK